MTGEIRGPGDSSEVPRPVLQLHPNGTFDVTDKATGRRHTGLNLLEDTEDIGDEYDYSPAAETETVTTAGLSGRLAVVEETGVPGMAAIRQARRAIDDLGKRGEITLIYAGGIRNGGDVAKAIALGADAIAIGNSAMMALNCNKDIPEADFEAEIGVEAGYCYHCHTGRCPVGITTQDPELRKRLDPDAAAERVFNFLHTLTIECQMMARACGKTNVHSLEPEDLAALTMEASAIAGVPLAGTDFTVGVEDYHHL